MKQVVLHLAYVAVGTLLMDSIGSGGCNIYFYPRFLVPFITFIGRN